MNYKSKRFEQVNALMFGPTTGIAKLTHMIQARIDLSTRQSLVDIVVAILLGTGGAFVFAWIMRKIAKQDDVGLGLFFLNVAYSLGCMIQIIGTLMIRDD